MTVKRKNDVVQNTVTFLSINEQHNVSYRKKPPLNSHLSFKIQKFKILKWR